MKRRLVCMMTFSVLGANAYGQSLDKPLQLASRGPAFYAIIGSHLERAETRNVAVLRKHMDLSLHDATIPDALTAIEKQTSLRFAFKPSIFPAGATVSLDARDITVAAALTQILLDADVDVQLAPYGLVSIVPRRERSVSSESAAGTIVGRVTNARTHTPIAYATLSLEGSGRSVTASDTGTFRIANVPAGTYVLVVHRLGYLVLHRSLTVTVDQTTDVECELEESPNQLDQVVVSGTLAPTSVKEVPSPVSVISDSEIAQQQPHSMMELFRQFVPTGVSFDLPQAPYFTVLSVRGATDFQSAGNMKVIIDGVETTNSEISPIDPASIERVEVIRGPEAAAIYGSGAIDGVMQVFTKRGDGALSRPQVDAQVSAGDVQTPYAGFRGVLRQSYSGDVRGGAPNASYNIGGGYTQTGKYIPDGEYSSLSSPSVYGGLHYQRAITSVDISGRYLVNNAPQVENPQEFNVGFVGLSKPNFTTNQVTNATVGATLGIQPQSWWRNTLRVGFDQYNSDSRQGKARLTTPSDTELTVGYSNESKTFVSANSSVFGNLGSGFTGNLTIGADHWDILSTSLYNGGVSNTSGTILADSAQPYSVQRNVETNSGLFAQVQLGYDDALFLTAGIRGDWNTAWGDSIGVPISPRVGASYARTFGITTVKLRASWGSALLPPSPTSKELVATTTSIVLANPRLGPVHQRGGDAGFDLAFGSHGSFSATYFNQTAVNLIQNVTLQSDSIPTSQNQNVGTVKNTGVELEATANVWKLSLRAVYGYTQSRINALAPGYTGDLQIGDQVSDFPKNTGGASLAFSPWRGGAVSGGLTYVGSWTDLDFLGLYRCFGAFTVPACPASFLKTFSLRSFYMSYPSLIKGNVTVSQQVTSLMSAFISVDNIGDNEGFEQNNSMPVFGRITTIGLRLHY